MSTTSPERGFAIPAALFILVVFAVFGAAMTTMSTVSNEETTLDVQQMRALRAAQAGLEWGFYQSSKAAATSLCATTGSTINLDASTLSGFTVTVTCTPITIDEAGSPDMTSVTAVACNAAACPGTPTSATYVERMLTGIVAGD